MLLASSFLEFSGLKEHVQFGLYDDESNFESVKPVHAFRCQLDVEVIDQSAKDNSNLGKGEAV